MPTSLSFCRDTLGFKVIGAAPPADHVRRDQFNWVWLRSDSAELMLNAAYDRNAVRPPAPDPARVAAHADTAVEAPTVAPYGMKQLYVKDPDGFTLCFQWVADA